MASKTKSKGTALLMSISTVYTAVPQIITMDKSGEKGETFDGRTLDGGIGLTKPSTGFVEPPVISGELFFDSANTVHLAMKAVMRTPVDTNFKITDAATVPVSEIWNVTVIGLDEKYAGNDGVKASFNLQCSGSVS